MWSVFGALKTTVSCTLYASFKIGQFIVTTLQTGLTHYLNFLGKLFALLGVIIEDFTIFLSDVINNLKNIFTFLWDICELITASISATWQSILHSLQVICNAAATVCNTCVNGILSTLKGMKNIFIILKHMMVMLGDGVWFIVVYIPKATILTCISALNYAKTECIRIFDNIYAYLKHLSLAAIKSIQECFHFLTDVPVESVIGIIIAMCFLYIFFQFYTVVYLYFCNKIFSLFYGLRRIYYQMKRTVSEKLSRTSQEVSERIFIQPAPTSSKISDDRYCIVCQDNPKCILVLPCRHLCLCAECTPRLLRYTGRCPMCRKRIHSTMKIFT